MVSFFYLGQEFKPFFSKVVNYLVKRLTKTEQLS